MPDGLDPHIARYHQTAVGCCQGPGGFKAAAGHDVREGRRRGARRPGPRPLVHNHQPVLSYSYPGELPPLALAPTAALPAAGRRPCCARSDAWKHSERDRRAVALCWRSCRRRLPPPPTLPLLHPPAGPLPLGTLVWRRHDARAAHQREWKAAIPRCKRACRCRSRRRRKAGSSGSGWFTRSSRTNGGGSSSSRSRSQQPRDDAVVQTHWIRPPCRVLEARRHVRNGGCCGGCSGGGAGTSGGGEDGCRGAGLFRQAPSLRRRCPRRMGVTPRHPQQAALFERTQCGERWCPMHVQVFDNLRPWMARGITKADLDACAPAATPETDTKFG